MRKNYVQNVIIHAGDYSDIHTLAGKVSEFHVCIIERRLSQSNLTMEQKITVIDKIMDNLKERKV